MAPANATAILTVDSTNTNWTLTFSKWRTNGFSISRAGWLTSIIDRNGNATQLTYDGINRLVTVTDPGGRHLYFGYPKWFKLLSYKYLLRMLASLSLMPMILKGGFLQGYQT